MSIIVVDDGNQITVTSDEIQATVNGLAHTVVETEASQAIPTNSVEQVVVTDGTKQIFTNESQIEIVVQTVADTIVKDMFLVNHSSTFGLLNDDHPQYHNDARGDLRYTPISHIQDGNPHNTQANEIPGISNWGLRVTAADQDFIEANMGPDAIPSTRIQSLVAGKIAAGIMAAKVSLADLFTASANGGTLNDDESGLALGANRIQMGYITDALNTYMLRHSNGYADNHPSYVSNFSVDESGNVQIAGTLNIIGGSGIANLSDAGALATRDKQSFFQPDPPGDPITGDLWYDTDNGNTPARWNGVAWDSVKDADILIALGSADSKIQTYFQTTAPTGLTNADNGDLWFDDDFKAHYYAHPGWNDAQDSSIAQAILDASNAQETADGKVTTYTGVAFPTTVEGVGDIFYNTTTKVQYRALVAPNPTGGDWEIIGNGFDETGLLTDTANLGGTADWTTVNDNGGKPEDYADVTDIGGANYVIRGLGTPNSTSGSVTAVNEGLANWGFTLPNSAASTQLMNFDLPPLKTSTNYVLSFWVYTSVVGSDMRVDLFPDSLPEHIVTVNSLTPEKHTYAFNSADTNMATAILRFFKLTSSTNPTASITVYDVKFEQGVQATDWTPYNPIVDKADDTKQTMEATVTVDSGGIIMNGTAAIHSYLKDSFADVTAGVYLGWDAGQAAYVMDVGDASNYVRWNGSTLSVSGNLTVGNPASVRTDLNVADGADVTNKATVEAAINGNLTVTGIITGVKVQTGITGQDRCILNESASNELRIYSASNVLLGSFGAGTVSGGSDNVIVDVGLITQPYLAVRALSAGMALQVQGNHSSRFVGSASFINSAADGAAISIGYLGLIGTGIYIHGANLSSVDTAAPLCISPMASGNPSGTSAHGGSMAVGSDTRLYLKPSDIGTWQPLPYLSDVENAMPVGTIISTGSSSALSGFLNCNGAAVSRTTYASLFSKIGTNFGIGDGSTTFNLPDLRGEFIRGWDNNKGTDPGRSLGSSQTDDLKEHTHTIQGNSGGSGYPNAPAGGGSYFASTGSTGGSETRPKNIALNFFIRY